MNSRIEEELRLQIVAGILCRLSTTVKENR